MPCYVHQELVSIYVLRHSKTSEKHMDEILDHTGIKATLDKFQISDKLLVLCHLVAFKVLLLDKLEHGCLFLIELLFSQFFFLNFLCDDSAKWTNKI